MDKQERNLEALIEHIAEQDRIIRRRNQQIENQASNARESQRAIDELCVRAVKAEKERDEAVAALDTTLARAMKAEHERDRLSAMHAQQVKTIAELQREVGLTRPDSITDEVVLRFLNEYDRLSQGAEPCRSLAYWQSSRVSLVRKSLIAALDNSPRPEGAASLDDPVAEALRVAAGCTTTRDEVRAVADVLADRGVRVVGDGA